MKSVSGKVLSTKPTSLSKAAKVLSNFVAAETGALGAVSTYLKRASSSFNDLVQLHKEIKPSRPDRNHKKHQSESVNNGNPMVSEQNPKKTKVGRNVEDSAGSENVGKREKQKKKKSTEILERESGGDLGAEEGERKEKKKKRKSGEIDDGEVVDSTEQSSSKKKKRRKIEGDH